MSTIGSLESPRARMVRSAARMIRERGVTGVGLRQIAADAGGPRGSLQRYFPGGKTQVMLEAIDLAVDDFGAGTKVAASDAASLAEAVRMMVSSWREVLKVSDFTIGCPIASFVVDVSAVAPLRERADERFTHWRKGIASIYREFGYDRTAAWDEALMVMSALEGAALIARAARDIEAIDAAERLLLDRVDTTRRGR
ncbi:TetR/AcrR family transcriptional regulator [Rhodococcoides fascians]|uniref:TetR/AcrR family transcriptional regulator n=1 Tax=Rhodococcoides fascians TaxID=1828 RepID=UPI00050C82D9|nr:TetR/AcrR family transcriptional regulator [Rhodococcus fascians]